MELIPKCILSDQKDKTCLFAQKQGEETHCALLIEWVPEDTRVKNLPKCANKMYNRERLSFRLSMYKKYPELKNKNTPE